MASVNDVKQKIKNANALGIANLSNKGVTVGEQATTYEIMQSIDKVVSGKAEMDALNTLINESGVLDSTEGTVTEKVEELIDKAECEAFVNNYVFRSDYTQNFKNTDLVSIPSVLDFSKITRCDDMFNRCAYLKEVNLDLNSATSCARMVAFCTSLETIRLTAPNCTSFSEFAVGCERLKSVDIQGVNNVKNFAYAFEGCVLLESIEGLNTSLATNTGRMFNGCSSLERLPLIDMSNVTGGDGMFGGCSSLKEVFFVTESIKCNFALGQSSDLTNESIDSVFEGLAYTENARTLYLHSAVILRLQDKHYQMATEKGWTIK